MSQLHHARPINFFALILSACAALAVGQTASAAPILSLNTTTIANAPDQVILITTADSGGGVQMGGFNLYLQIGDGGTYNKGSTSAPTITDVTMQNAPSGVFVTAASESLELVPDPNGLIAYNAVNLPAHTTTGDTGVLAKLTIDASALAPGSSFQLSFFDVDSTDGPFDSNYVDSSSDQQPVTLSNDGTFFTIHTSAVPEPASLSLLAVGSLGLLMRKRRR